MKKFKQLSLILFLISSNYLKAELLDLSDKRTAVDYLKYTGKKEEYKINSYSYLWDSEILEKLKENEYTFDERYDEIVYKNTDSKKYFVGFMGLHNAECDQDFKTMKTGTINFNFKSMYFDKLGELSSIASSCFAPGYVANFGSDKKNMENFYIKKGTNESSFSKTGVFRIGSMNSETVFNIYSKKINLELEKTNKLSKDFTDKAILSISGYKKSIINLNASESLEINGDIMTSQYFTPGDSLDTHINLNWDSKYNGDVKINGNFFTENIIKKFNNENQSEKNTKNTINVKMNTANSYIKGFVLDINNGNAENTKGTTIDMSNGAAWYMADTSTINNLILKDFAILDLTYANKDSIYKTFPYIRVVDKAGFKNVEKNSSINTSINTSEDFLRELKGKIDEDIYKQFSGEKELYKHIYINNLSGKDGRVLFKIGDDNSTKVYVEKEHTGHHFTEFTDPKIGTILAYVKKGTGVFEYYDDDKLFESGFIVKEKESDNKDYGKMWYIAENENKGKLNRIVDSIIDKSNKNYAYMNETDSLLKRMGSISDVEGVYARIKNKELEVGYNKKFGLSALIGLERYGLNLNYTDILKNGLYTDNILSFNLIKNNISKEYPYGRVHSAVYKDKYISLSTEFGYEKKLKENLSIIPYAKIKASYMLPSEFESKNNHIKGKESSVYSLIPTLGIYVKKKVSSKVDIYSGLSASKDLFGKRIIHFNDNYGNEYVYKDGTRKMNIDLNVKVNAKLTDKLNTYGSLEYSLNNGANFTFGIKYMW